MTDIATLFRESVEASLQTKRRVLETALPAVERAADLLLTAYQNGNKALFFGNGGSAADAQHLAAEMEGRFGFDRAPLPALALHANVSTLTAIANDYAYEALFARLLTAHARSRATSRSPSRPAARRRTSCRCRAAQGRASAVT